MEIAPKYKVKQGNNAYSNINFWDLLKNILRVPNDCSQKVLQFIAVWAVHSSLSAWISSVHIDKVLAWLRFRKVYVLKASFSKTFLQITFPPNYKQVQTILRRKFPSKYKPSRFWNAIFPPNISPLKSKPLKKGLWKI